MMTKLDDFLGPLHQGVWEVVVSKSEVTEPLDEGWKKSEINIPSPEMIASYRKGQYHTHETKEEYKTHMDRYDPEKSPGLHLIDDAPMVLMIWGTMSSLFLTAKDASKGNRMDRMAAMNMTWKVRMAMGAALLAVGAILILFPLEFAKFTFSILMPLAVVGFGAFMLYNGFRMDKGAELAKRDKIIGVIVIALGLAMFALWEFFVLLILLVLAVWFFASAFVSLRRSLKGKAATPEGFWIRLIMAILSLGLGILTLFAPKDMVSILIIVLGAIVILIGILFLIDGYGLRNALKLMEEKPTIYT
jgi:uncharacterized membrane protein HdeD (DUF308 family)